MKILLIGHACGPGMGSEPGLTWNWAQHLSRSHQVWVLAHPEFRSQVEEEMRANPNPQVQFVWVSVDSILDPWKPGRSERGIKIHYLLWSRKVFRVARKLCQQIRFDIVHHVSWATVNAAPRLWQLPVPFVWGPIGGGQQTPVAFLRYFGARGWQEVLRNCYVHALRFSPSLRKAARNAAVVLATNRETEQLLKRIDGARVQPFLDCGLPPDWVPPGPPVFRESTEFTLLWVGRLEHRKALALALESVAGVRAGISVRLLVAGTGVLKPKLEALAAKLGVASRVEFLGSVPFQKMPALSRRADACLFTSLRDSSGTVVLEAMAQGLPIICLDHQGVGTFVPDEAGIKVPVTTPRETIQSLAGAIEALSGSASLRRKMQVAGWSFAKTQTWDERAKRMSRLYEQVISNRSSRLGEARVGSEVREVISPSVPGISS